MQANSIIIVCYGYFKDFEYILLYFVNNAAVSWFWYCQKLRTFWGTFVCPIFGLCKENDIFQVCVFSSFSYTTIIIGMLYNNPCKYKTNCTILGDFFYFFISPNFWSQITYSKGTILGAMFCTSPLDSIKVQKIVLFGEQFCVLIFLWPAEKYIK